MCVCVCVCVCVYLHVCNREKERERERERELGRESERASTHSGVSYKDTNTIRSGTCLMTSFKLNYLLLDCFLNTVTLGVSSTYEFGWGGRDTIQSIEM